MSGPTRKPRLLDAFCCQGGAGKGYADAGFDVVGVDIEPQPRYPFELHQADALAFISSHWREFDAIHASPTCQHQARVTDWRGSRDDHPDTLGPTLRLLRRLPVPYVVENVPEAIEYGLRPDLMLCGSMFGLPIRRHRIFEIRGAGFTLQPPCNHQRTDLPFMHKGERAFADAMGCGWMTNRGGRQAVPPAYTRFIGEQLLAHISEETVVTGPDLQAIRADAETVKQGSFKTFATMHAAKRFLTSWAVGNDLPPDTPWRVGEGS